MKTKTQDPNTLNFIVLSVMLSLLVGFIVGILLGYNNGLYTKIENCEKTAVKMKEYQTEWFAAKEHILHLNDSIKRLDTVIRNRNTVIKNHMIFQKKVMEERRKSK